MQKESNLSEIAENSQEFSTVKMAPFITVNEGITPQDSDGSNRLGDPTRDNQRSLLQLGQDIEIYDKSGFDENLDNLILIAED